MIAVTAFGAANHVASGWAKEVSHHVTFGADMVFFGVLVWMLTDAKKDNSLAGLGPLILAVLSITLLMIDPTRHLLLDHGGVFCEPASLRMYMMVDKKQVLSPIGAFSQAATIVGFILLALAVMSFFGAVQRLWSLVCGGGSQRGQCSSCAV